MGKSTTDHPTFALLSGMCCRAHAAVSTLVFSKGSSSLRFQDDVDSKPAEVAEIAARDKYVWYGSKRYGQ